MKALTRIFVSLTPLAVMFLVTSQIHAVCSEPKIRVDDEFFVSELVFSGTIVADRKVGLASDGAYDGHDFSWRINEVYRGAVRAGELVHTYSSDDSARFPWDAEDGHQVGRRFLIFTFPDSEHKGQLAVDDCGNSALLSKAARTIAEIRTLPNGHGGLLYGEMFDGDIGVRIIATAANGKTYSALSNRNGKFTIRLPSGTYSVTAAAPGRIYEDFELAYKTSHRVTVPNGGSAGLAFREKGWDGKRLPYSPS
jgi:hypothetical protein